MMVLLRLWVFRDGWHGLCLYAPNGHGTRLAQVANKHHMHIYIYVGKETLIATRENPSMLILELDVLDHS